jgi:undecaprenyl diphosphate synthase
MGLHLGIVMDGNGRWAERRGLPRAAGHRAGAAAARRIIETAPGLGVGTVTLYAFSSDNWRRPLPEVASLLQLVRRFLETEMEQGVAQGVWVNVIGRRDRLPSKLVRAIRAVETATAGGKRLLLRIALDYSSRDAIRRAAIRLARSPEPEVTGERFGELIGEVDHARLPVGPIDVLVRTGGEQRLSDFLLWECAYAELFFRPELWPDFRPEDLAEVLAAYRARERRFGGLAAAI